MASTFAEMISLQSTDKELVYASKFPPSKMGNAANIAYGGCALSVAVAAAYRSLPEGTPSYSLYSAQGSYLGPATTDTTFTCTVRRIRDTRTFVTRTVEVSQLRDGKARGCLFLYADFQVLEHAAVLSYCKPPSMQYSSPDECPTLDEQRQKVANCLGPKLGPKLAKMHAIQFGLLPKLFGYKPCPEGIGAQNLSGMAKGVQTTQEDRQVWEKTSAEWMRNGVPLSGEGEQAAALAFVMDAAISFLPLTISHSFFDEVSACSSLDFSVRIFGPFDFNDWHLREIKTVTGGYGRTYSEGQLWDRSGRMVANMTQQCILRPKNKL